MANNQEKPVSKPLVAAPSRRNPRLAASAQAPKIQARRVLRTVVFGTVALGAGVWYLADMFGVDRGELVGYLSVSALLLCGLILLAAVTVGLLRLLRR